MSDAPLPPLPENSIDLIALTQQIKSWAKDFGFQDARICDLDLSKHQGFLQDWLDNGYHGDMAFMETHADLRADPAKLLPGTVRIISVRLDYLPPNAAFARTLKSKTTAYISRYALGRDYHKLMRNKLKKLGEKIRKHCESLEFRPFVDSAPVLEHAVAEKAGIGWTGKHALTINKQAGSWFFLGELFISLPLPVDEPVEEQCGSCSACLTICPTQAIVAPYKVDARRCISYLTIELKDAIPEEFRPLMGNRIYGCDDCQLICPWNRYANVTEEKDFFQRQALSGQTLIDLFAWSEETFLKNTEGSAIRRIGHERWLRNIAVALGNAPYSPRIVTALTERLQSTSNLVKEHIEWALDQHRDKLEQDPKLERLTERLIRSVEKGLPRDA